MSNRSNYSEDYCGDYWTWIRWRGAVTSSIRGKRGQAFLKELLETLDGLPEKKLISNTLATPQGEVCALGSVMCKRGLDAEKIDPYDYEQISTMLNIPESLVREIEYINDDQFLYTDGECTPEEARFKMVRQWVENHIIEVMS